MVFIYHNVKDNYGKTTQEREANAKAMRHGIFEPYEIVLYPLSERESRVIPYTDKSRTRKEMSWSKGTCYRAYSFAIGVTRYQSGEVMSYYLLVDHGSGRGVIKINAALAETVIDISHEINQFRTLFSIYRMAADAFQEGGDKLRKEYATAFVEKRLKKRTRNGFVCVEVLARLVNA